MGLDEQSLSELWTTISQAIDYTYARITGVFILASLVPLAKARPHLKRRLLRKKRISINPCAQTMTIEDIEQRENNHVILTAYFMDIKMVMLSTVIVLIIL